MCLAGMCLNIDAHATDAQTSFRIALCKLSKLGPRSAHAGSRSIQKHNRQLVAKLVCCVILWTEDKHSVDFLETTRESAFKAGKQRRWQRKELPCSLITTSWLNVSLQHFSPCCVCGVVKQADWHATRPLVC